MTENQNLGGFDMVLGLSQSTINFQFKMLYQNGFIKDRWFALVGNVLNPKEGEKPFCFEGTPEELKSKLNRWISIQDQFSAAYDADNIDDMVELKNIIKTEGLNFDYAWDVDLKSPTVEIINKDPRNLYFNLSFSEGKLYYRPEKTSKVKLFDLSGCVYAFTTPIGRIKVAKDQMVMEADEAMDSIIRNSGLTEADFRIESLFLNFENANISDFDIGRSKFPEGLIQPFQVTIENYFKLILKGSTNPYVLGYGVTQPKINSQEAMFQPTSLEFSTSYSTKTDQAKPVKGQYSSFNFLMMLNGDPAPTEPTAGILPASLIELGMDTSSTTDGVFAMDRSHFDQYLDSLDEYVVSVFKAKKDVKVESGGFQVKDGKHIMVATSHMAGGELGDDKIDTTYTLERKALKNVSGGVEVEYEFQVEIVVHLIAKVFVEIELKKIDLSTSGQYSYRDVKGPGKVGSMKFLIQNGTEGKFNLKNTLEPPKIAFDESVYLFEGGALKIFLNIVKLILAWPILLVEGIINQIAIDLSNNDVTKENESIKRLREVDVLNQTNKVILPLGKTYAYKNLRAIEDKSLIAYDITYAPVNE
ncbi:hypothetical protein [Algoriphagus sp. PAP.12]|uniref:hypothetical protein n=1 Tax=Algoriphagus sp. PAP.12 TaxID=2996678 RepID=UPI00227C238F|nr:hypothetical protein [Algoriphagus sp. PAP.12]